MQLAWALAAASPAVLAYLPLIAGIARGTVRAERLSWAIWAAEYALLFAVQAARGGGPLLYLIGAGTAGCLLTFTLTLWRGSGGVSLARLAVLAGALAALAAWRQARNPSLAFVLLLAVETAAIVPTVLNAYHTGAESVTYWLLIALAAVLELPALALAARPASLLSYAFAITAAIGALTVLSATTAGRLRRGGYPAAVRDLPPSPRWCTRWDER